MRRLHAFLILSALVAISIATPLQAQSADSASSTRMFVRVPASSALNLGSSSTPKSHPSFMRRVVTGLAAAIAGAYVGYFFSEVAHGDWSGAHTNRGLWAEAGSAGGFILGFSFATGSRPKLSGLPSGLPVGRSMITAKEIASSKATTAYEAVQDLRPAWLPNNVAFVSARVSVPFESDISVYEDSKLIGGLEELAKVPVRDVAAMYRLNADEATARFNAPDPNGAILIITKH